MPITDTLKNAEELRRAGFPEQQANLLAAKLEETAQAQSEDLKSFIRTELGNMEARMEARFDARIESVRAEMHSLARDQLLKFITVMALMFSVAVAVIKLFPNLS